LKGFSGPAQPRQRARGLVWACASASLILFLALSIWFSLARGPWWDEGLFADVAINFCRSGHLRSSVLAPYSFNNMPAVDRYCYWQLPSYLVSLGLWFRILPATVEWMRIFSVFWGCIFIACWFLFVRALTRNETLALLVASVVALDFSCIAASSNGRMDMMCAALGQAALAAYVCLRDSHPRQALGLAGILGASSLFCHPMGAATNAWLLALLLTDRHRLRRWMLWPAVLPYVIAGGACLFYILQAPKIFLAQAKDVSSYRVGGIAFMFANLLNDIRDRYLQFYFAPHSGSHKLKVFCLLFGVAGLLAIALNKKLRSEKLARLLVSLALVSYAGVALIDDLKYPYYFVYVTPILSACGAVWLYYTFQIHSSFRWIASGLLGAFVAATAGATAFFIRRNEFATEYRPAAAMVRQALRPGEIVMGPSELGFALGFGPPLVDDCYLGFRSGIRPQIYVMYSSCTVAAFSAVPWEWSRKVLAADYHRVFANAAYGIYLRNGH
jgi:hypothetical protein